MDVTVRGAENSPRASPRTRDMGTPFIFLRCATLVRRGAPPGPEAYWLRVDG